MLKIASIVLIALGIFFLYLGITDPFNLFDSGISLETALIGISQIVLAISMQRLSKLEDTLARYIYNTDKDDMPNKLCDKCGRKYDMDVEECPYCEVKKLKLLRKTDRLE